MAGECLNSEMEYAIKDHKILPMIVICLCKVDFHLGLRHLCRQGGKNLVFQHKVKNDLLFGCFSKKLLHTARLVTTGSAKETDAANKTSFFSKTKPPFTLDKQSRTEQIKSDKVEEALEASVEEFLKSPV